MDAVRLILVGGFLGAGKTTLLWEAARRLISQGRRVGLITNDQAPDLVDTALLLDRGLDVREVAGSCFCCGFDRLIQAAEELQHDVQADVLLAEPVGSCTDLSATILQPLKDRFRGRFALSPFSVLVDPDRLDETLAGKDSSLHRSAAYIVRKQMEEADWIVVHKVDLLSADRRDQVRKVLEGAFPEREIRWLSAKTGEGVDPWLRAALSEARAGRRIAEVDYDKYAEGEAALGWLNAVVRLSRQGGATVEWRAFCERLLDCLRQAFIRSGAAVGHVKLLLTSVAGRCTGSLTRTDGPISISGDIRGADEPAWLILNARVQMSPEQLEQASREALARAAGWAVKADLTQLRCLRPGRPSPTYRYDRVV